MEAAIPGIYFCAPGQFGPVNGCHRQELPSGTKQRLQCRGMRQGLLKREGLWQEGNEDDNRMLQQEQELRQGPKLRCAQDKKSETGKDGHEETAQHRKNAAAHLQPSKSCLLGACAPAAAQDALPQLRRDHFCLLRAAAAVTGAPTEAVLVGTVPPGAAVRRASLVPAASGASSRPSEAAVLGTLYPFARTSASPCRYNASLPPVTAAAATAARPAGAPAAPGRVPLAVKPDPDSNSAALMVPCPSALIRNSASALRLCCVRFASLLQLRLLVLLLLMCNLLLLRPPMRVKALSLGALEKRPLQALMSRSLTDATTSSRPQLVFRCRTPTVSLGSSAFSSSVDDAATSAAQWPAATATHSRDLSRSSVRSVVQPRRSSTAMTSTRVVAASASHADVLRPVDAAEKIPAAAAKYRRQSIARQDARGGIAASAFPSVANSFFPVPDTATCNRLDSFPIAFAGTLAGTGSSGPLAQQLGPYKWSLRQRRSSGATLTLLPHAALPCQTSTCAAGVAGSRRAIATAAEPFAAAVAGAPHATSFSGFGAADAACGRGARELSTLSATGSPVFQVQRVSCLAFDCPVRAAAVSAHAGISRRIDEARLVNVAAEETPPAAATVTGKASGRLTKTTAAGSLRAAEYVGAAAGGRPRHVEASLNRVTLIGRLGAEPEIRQMSNGEKFAWFSMATSSHWVDKATGDMQARTEWHRVVVYEDSLVDLVDKYLQLRRTGEATPSPQLLHPVVYRYGTPAPAKVRPARGSVNGLFASASPQREAAWRFGSACTSPAAFGGQPRTTGLSHQTRSPSEERVCNAVELEQSLRVKLPLRRF